LASASEWRLQEKRISCGAAAANAYCHTQEFTSAMSYRKVDHGDITDAIPAGGSGGCGSNHCDIVAIVCAR